MVLLCKNRGDENLYSIQVSTEENKMFWCVLWTEQEMTGQSGSMEDRKFSTGRNNEALDLFMESNRICTTGGWHGDELDEDPMFIS